MKLKRGVTSAEWDGNHLVIHWFGIRALDSDTGAHWNPNRFPNAGALVFEGLSVSKGWKLSEKPSAEKALRMIQDWQNYG